MKGLFKVLLVLTGLIATPIVSGADSMTDIFGEGVFNTKWGMSLDEVKAIHPSGKVEDVFSIVTYYIKDGRALFGIEREKGSRIGFVFGADKKLVGVSVDMPAGTKEFAQTMMSITSAIGVEGEGVNNTVGVSAVKWNDGTGIEIVLLPIPGMFSPSLTLSIEKKLVAKDTTKEVLGF